MSLFGSLPERNKQSGTGLFADDDPPSKQSSGLFADDVEDEDGDRQDDTRNDSAPSHSHRSHSHERSGAAPPPNRQPYSEPDADPWASPANVQRHQRPPNGYSMSDDGPQRTTSTFTSSGDTQVEGVTSGGFGESTSPQIRKIASRHVSQGAQEMLTVTTLPEKEGMFLFQYRNYEIASTRKNSKVIRRYSDFVWLLDCLHKRYPFRQLPLLPPKRVSINGNHIAADTLFIEKRRRGLTRFANALIRHPVLREEQLVTMFLTVPTELAAWRKQASITVQEEFVGKVLPPTLEDSLPPTIENLFDTVRSGVQRSAEMYINLCTLFERLVKRNEGLASDFSRVSLLLQSLTEVSAETYHMDTNDVPLLNEGINSTFKHVATHQGLIEEESRAWDEGVLEDLKRQRDTLVSMRDMFDRRDRYAKENIPQLERRIAGNENKLSGVRAKPEGVTKPGEAEKLEDAIMKDKESIVQQHARGVLIKECIRNEIRTFQSSQYNVSRLHQDWSAEQIRNTDAKGDNWKSLGEQLESMPTSQGE